MFCVFVYDSYALHSFVCVFWLSSYLLVVPVARVPACRFCPVSLCEDHFQYDAAGVIGETAASLFRRARNPYPRTRTGSGAARRGRGRGRGGRGRGANGGRGGRGRGGSLSDPSRAGAPHSPEGGGGGWKR